MPAQTKRTKFRAGCQAYVEPLHCRANSRHATPGVKRAVPMGSGLFYFFLVVSAEALGAGTWRIRAMIRNVTTPIGRFI